MSDTRIETRNEWYRDRYPWLIYTLYIEMVLVVVLVLVVFYQLFHRPLPLYSVVTTKGQVMRLVAHDEPNLLSTTLITWASKAAVAAYTFNFADYEQQIALARPYFTPEGWASYQAAISNVLGTVIQNKLIVNSVVSGAPVMASEGDLFGMGYAWRIQIPFLVTYQSSEKTERKTFTVIVTIVKVPTTVNPAGIGIDQFLMV